MSYHMPEKHAYVRVSEDIKRDEVSNLLFLYGVEGYLINWARKALVEKFVNPAVATVDLDVFETDKFEFHEFRQAVETMPIMSERKVIIVEDLKTMWFARDERLNKEDRDILIEMLASLPHDIMVIFICGDKPADIGNRETDLFKICKKRGEIYRFDPLREGDLERFIIKRFKAAGVVSRSHVIQMICSESGYYNKDVDYNLFNLENDLLKICALSDGNEITIDDVRNGLSHNLEHSIFGMLDKISVNRKGEAFKLLNQLLLSGSEPMGILGLLANHFELMVQVKEMQGEGMPVGQMKNILKVHEYRIKKAAGFASKFSINQLKQTLVNGYDIERDVRNGKLTVEIGLEMFIAEI